MEFNALVDEILEFLWRSSPTSASFAGIHKYDHELDNRNRGFLEEINIKNKDYLKQLGQIDQEKLSESDGIDWQLLKNTLEFEIKDFEEIRTWQRNPAAYVDNFLYSIFLLYIRDFAPLEERAGAMLSRMRAAHTFFKEVKENLQGSPEIFTNLAISNIANGQLFIKSIVPAVASGVPGLEPELRKAAADAAEALADYKDFLVRKHLPLSTGNFAIGKEHFNAMLALNHMLPYDADAILALGWQEKEATEKEMIETARALDSTRSCWELIEDLKNEHPSASDLLTTYKREMLAARQHTIDNNLVTIPPNETLEVIPTPLVSRSTIPYGAYLTPAPFEKDQKGFFYVTTIDDNLPSEQKEKLLKGHSIYGITIIALHEAYPGHHLQLVLSNQIKSKVRKLVKSAVFAEGWALYCEELMQETNFYSDPRTRLFKLKGQYWRACRVIIDVSLHTGKMSFDQAVDMLVHEARLEKPHAEQEVTRYTYSPTQPLSYMVGKNQIKELRRDYEKKLGEEFRLRDFHDRLLGFGTIPFVLIRRLLGLPVK